MGKISNNVDFCDNLFYTLSIISVGDSQNMERKINEDLLKWKRDSINKPFFLYGPKCIGKTFSVLEFGQKFYRNIAYFNTSGNTILYDTIDKEKSLDKLVSKLSLLCGETIFNDDTLIVFDNVNDEKFMKVLKIFGNNNSPYQVIIISNNKMEINKLRIEEFYYRGMMNMDFFEYLSNSDKIQLIDFIKDSYENNTPMPFHQMALDTYYDFLETGGFPEVVNAKLNGASDLEIEALKKKIMDIYGGEYSKFDLFKCEEIISVLPICLSKDNKKFQYGMIKKGARSKDYEDSINYLVTNGLINRSYRLNEISSPLMGGRDLDSFKLYFNDVGLLYTNLFVNKARLMTDNDIKRCLIENDIANTLVKLGYSLYYYQSDGKAEISFIVQNRNGKIIPIEIVNMKLTKAKAMSVFLNKFNLTDCVRLTENNFSKRKGVKMVPVYAACCLKDL